jgi:D-beta-D-heptose 7-phosphate kinase/D-beta-D-heptose 1-phosphate adenosyltransferase
MTFVPLPKALDFSSALDRRLISEESKAWKRRGRTVAVAPGCFDLIGPHHIYLLREASKLASFFIVAVNSDNSVRRIKGPNRPVYTELERVDILMQISCVDYVILFDSDTPRDLLKAINPDFLVKGDVPGQITDGEEFAGKVVKIPLIVNKSTTQTIQRLQQDLAGVK